jgi:uncharacterized membrane protein
MTTGALQPNLPRLVQAMTPAEVETMRTAMGIDVVAWSVNESAVSQLERQLAEYRSYVADTPKEESAELRELEQRMKCASCLASGRQAEMYVTLKESTTVCARCLEFLLKQVRLGKR